MPEGDRTGIAEQYCPQCTLEHLGPMLCDVFGAERAGLARITGCSQHFENIALWDLRDDTRSCDRFFSRSGTVASWTLDTECPFAGESIVALNPFPSTQAYLVRHRFASNLLLPIELHRFGRGVFYLLSRKTGAYGMRTIAAGQRFRGVLEPALRAYFAALELEEGADDEPTDTRRALIEADSGMLTLEQAQRRHIEDALTRTNWVIDGPAGAARILDVRPSTLRNRMHRLGLRRPDRGRGD